MSNSKTVVVEKVEQGKKIFRPIPEAGLKFAEKEGWSLSSQKPVSPPKTATVVK